MSSPKIVRGSFWEGSPVYPRAQWPNEDGVLWQLSDFSAITLRVYDLSTNTSSTAIYSNGRTLANVLTNTPAAWSLDSVGYNFHDTITVAQAPFEGGHSYRMEYQATRTDGLGAEYLVFEGRAEPNSAI